MTYDSDGGKEIRKATIEATGTRLVYRWELCLRLNGKALLVRFVLGNDTGDGGRGDRQRAGQV